MRVNKYLASIGLGSRREIDRWLEEGRISQKGTILKVGTLLENFDHISFDGRVLDALAGISPSCKKSLVLMYHKPLGEISARSKGITWGRTIFDTLPSVEGRWIAIGRLDVQTSGLLLFTNDGDLAHRCMHPSFGLKRYYRAKVQGHFNAHHPAWTEGADVDENSRPLKVLSYHLIEQQAGYYWIDLVLGEGRYRAVRRFFQFLGHHVIELQRTGFGPIMLDSTLQRGEHRLLNKEEITSLLNTLADE